jgi:solute carrier family 10 (sodium/bile acid cotransporter), member 7
VSISLFLMAWSLESSQLLRAILRPLPALWAAAISYGAVPLFAWSLGPILQDDFRVGLVMIASAPCTIASAVLWTRLAGGNDATALLIVMLTTATSWLLTTAWVMWGTGASIELRPQEMMLSLFLVLVVPVAVGQLGRIPPPLRRFVSKHRGSFGVVSQTLILAIILKAVVDLSLHYQEQTTPLSLGAALLALVACLGTHLLGLAFGLWTTRWLGFDRPSQIAVAIAGSQKSLPVALVLFDAYFKDKYPLAVLPLVFYHVGQLVTDTFIAENLKAESRS